MLVVIINLVDCLMHLCCHVAKKQKLQLSFG